MNVRGKAGKDGMTPPQRAFAKEYARTGDGVYSATKAGYAHPDVRSSEMLRHPVISASIKQQQARRLNDELLPKALDLLERVLEDESAKHSDRITAAKVVVTYTLGAKESGQDKAPEDMSAAELAERMATLRARQAQLAEGAKVIDLEPEGDVFG